MAIKCRVVEIDEKLDGTKLVLGFPDETGTVLELKIDQNDVTTYGIVEGGRFTLGFNPDVAAENKAAVAAVAEEPAKPAEAASTATTETAVTDPAKPAEAAAAG